MRCNGSNWAVYSPGSWDGFRNYVWALWAGVIMRLEHHLVGGYVCYISPYIIIIIILWINTLNHYTACRSWGNRSCPNINSDCTYSLKCRIKRKDYSIRSIYFTFINPNPLGILARNLPESSKLIKCTFWKHALTLIFKMHHAFSLIFHIQHLMACTSCQAVILPHLKRVKVPVSNSAEFFQKKCPLEDFGGFGVVRVNYKWQQLIHIISREV